MHHKSWVIKKYSAVFRNYRSIKYVCNLQQVHQNSGRTRCQPTAVSARRTPVHTSRMYKKNVFLIVCTVCLHNLPAQHEPLLLSPGSERSRLLIQERGCWGLDKFNKITVSAFIPPWCASSSAATEGTHTRKPCSCPFSLSESLFSPLVFLHTWSE